MNENNIKDENVNMQIRKFLKQVGVSTNQIIDENLNLSENNLKVELKLEINEKEVKRFSANFKNKDF